MKNKVVAFVIGLYTSVSFAYLNACPPALPSNAPGFCSSFKMSAECYCTASGLPRGMCTNMDLLYNRMVSTFGSLNKACEFQRDTPVQTCVDAWNCYRQGGQNSKHELCNSTGRSCL